MLTTLDDTPWTERTWMPREVVRRGDPTDLFDQFVLGRSVDAPLDWEIEKVDGWSLAHHPSLPVVPVVDGAGDDAGWLLGYPISSHGRLLTAADRVVAPAPEGRGETVDGFGGRFVAVFAAGPEPQVWPDACGTFSIVYCPSQQLVASSPSLVPYESETGDRTELVRQLGIPHVGSMYPAGMTARFGVDRLLANHHLDLSTMRTARHGPRSIARGSLSLDEAVDRVASAVAWNVSALAAAAPCYLPLTGGEDSRMLLACSREYVPQLACYTLALPDRNGATDVAIARRLARRHGLRHQVVPMLEPDPDDLFSWAYRTGCCTGEPRGWAATTSYRSLDRRRVRLGGNIGDASRGAYWWPTDRPDTEITVERLARHGLSHQGPLRGGQVEAARSPEVAEYLERWIAESTAGDALTMLDHFYLENRIGSWAGVFASAEYYDPGYTVFPMCHRDVVDTVLALPEDVRRAESDPGTATFTETVIAARWPELLDTPVNTAPLSLKVKRAPGAAVRRVRRLAGRLRSPA